MGIKYFQASRTSVYEILFDEYEEGPFEVPPCCVNVGITIQPVPGATKLHVLQDINIVYMLCSLSSELFWLQSCSILF